jgi:prevent-host-death family protein
MPGPSYVASIRLSRNLRSAGFGATASASAKSLRAASGLRLRVAAGGCSSSRAVRRVCARGADAPACGPAARAAGRGRRLEPAPRSGPVESRFRRHPGFVTDHPTATTRFAPLVRRSQRLADEVSDRHHRPQYILFSRHFEDRVKTATARDLRQKTAALLQEVRQGREVLITYRGRRIAVLTPLGRASKTGLNPVGFGMWRGRADLRSVGHWLRTLRAPRHRR